MRNFRSILGYCAFALAYCVGFGSSAIAATLTTVADRISYIDTYGADVAKFKAEQIYMVGLEDTRTVSTGGLTVESNGYRMTAMVTSEVAKGMTGVGAGNRLV